VAATLSLMLSEKADKSVLLVDANVQAPRIHQLLGVPDSRGLAGCLREKRRLQDVVSPVDTLPVLPARLDEGPVVRLFRTAAAKRLLEKMRRLLGVPDSPGPDDGQREESHLQNAVSPAGTLHVLPAGQDENSARFFRTAAAKRLLGEIRQTYDLALVDLPPLTSTSEAAALCDWSDGTIMVVRANATPAPTVTKALEMINSRKLLGIVLNREQRELPRWLERLLSGGVSSLCKG
jgi:Mrp family chromosome partitioning ATPase